MAEVKLSCEACGHAGAHVSTLQVFIHADDYHESDIHILCECANCHHFGRVSLKRIVENVMEG